HLLRPCLEVATGVLARTHGSRRFDDDVDTQVSPRELGWVAFLAERDLVPVDDQSRAVGGDLPRVPTVDRVVLEQIRQAVEFGEVVDTHHLEAVVFQELLERAASDSAEAVDSHADHRVPPSSSSPET